MTDAAASPEAYLAALPDDRRAVVTAVCEAIRPHLPEGIEEGMQYGMIGWYVPHSIHPDGYHCNPEEPVPYASVANQKAKVSVYLFCMYTDPDLAAWFADAYRAWLGRKPDMGKSCVRFKRVEDVPVELLAEVVRRMPLDTFLDRYTARIPARSRRRKG